MSYQVLARKWRPANFEELVGQEHVLRAMINALNSQRLHHAYLFTGTRGVGKTTLARILAKCLNCETGVSATPCGQCSACMEIAEGRFLDLIEVDAASRTKVDDTRELLDNVQYAPTRGRYKVYLIDEVHMLSTHSFNALLKTLEEPPPHVKFLLATTDPQKLPVTVLSRCLQFNLKQVPEAQIIAHLEKILNAEGVPFERPALRHLAHAAEGSLRDALSLLDQGIAFGEGSVKETDIGQMLGSISQQHLFSLLQAVAAGDAEAMMRQVDELASLGPDYDSVLASLITLLHDLALAQHIPHSLEMRGLDVQELSAIATLMNPEDIQLYYEIVVRARRDLGQIPDPRNALEMALLRMLAFRPATEPSVQAVVAPVAAVTPAPVPRKPATQPPLPAARPEPVTPPKQAVAPTPPPSPVRGGTITPEAWDSILPQLPLTGMSKAFSSHCTLKHFEGGVATLQLSSRHESLINDSVLGKISKALSDFQGSEVKVRVDLSAEKPDSPAEKLRRQAEQRQREAEASIEADPVVQNLKEVFNAEVVPGSVKPINQER
ncbi:MAG TPA: DNA polymerase III subunit gamma/tau [Gammaproteobacteria bacterium]|nr:DNA polymerase III subunit gamma/tau [Gammaproteobacteria bacterium]